MDPSAQISRMTVANSRARRFAATICDRAPRLRPRQRSTSSAELGYLVEATQFCICGSDDGTSGRFQLHRRVVFQQPRLMGCSGQFRISAPLKRNCRDSKVLWERPLDRPSERVARALARVDRLDATQAREKAYAEERAIAKAKPRAPSAPFFMCPVWTSPVGPSNNGTKQGGK